MNVKFHKNCENTGEILKISYVTYSFVKFDIIFSGSHKKLSLVLLQMTNYIFSPWKKEKRMRYCLSYSGTGFLSTKNRNYSIFWWIPS